VAGKLVMEYKDTGSPAHTIKLLSLPPKLCANLSDPLAEPSGHKIEAEVKEVSPAYQIILLS
jgi:hypothetical protein